MSDGTDNIIIIIIVIFIIIKFLYERVIGFPICIPIAFSNNFRPFELNFCVKMKHLLHQLRTEIYKRKILWKKCSSRKLFGYDSQQN